MQIGVLGINHKLATLALREELVKKTLSPLKKGSCHYVYLATCNRIEIYFSSKDLATTHSQLLQLLCDQMQEEVAHKFYSYFRGDCFLHLAKVTAGFDSALQFETEIQGQVKRAYQEAATQQLLCYDLHYLFQKSLNIGKKIRTLFPLGQKIASLEKVIASVGTSFFGSLLDKNILFVGLSKINCKIAYYLRNLGVQKIDFCNRSLNKQMVFPLYHFDHFHKWDEYDMIFFGTTYPDYLLKEGHTSKEIHQKKLLIDLSVPRNVHTAMGKVKNVTLLNIEQLHKLLNRKHKPLERIESEQIQQLVTRHLQSFHHRQKVVPIARASLREREE